MYHQKPINALKEKSLIWNVAIETQEFAKMMDQEDQFSTFRSYFSFPKKKDLPHSKLLYLINTLDNKSSDIVFDIIDYEKK